MVSWVGKAYCLITCQLMVLRTCLLRLSAKQSCCIGSYPATTCFYIAVLSLLTILNSCLKFLFQCHLLQSDGSVHKPQFRGLDGTVRTSNARDSAQPHRIMLNLHFNVLLKKNFVLAKDMSSLESPVLHF